jgi:hypothetical protein
VQILGNLWEVVETYEPQQTAFVTLLASGMLLSTDELMSVDPRTLKKHLLNDIACAERRLRTKWEGAGKFNGFAFASLDAEFDANRHGGVWNLHWHVIACGYKVEVFDELRSAPKYDNARADPREEGLPETPRVHIIRGLYNRPDPLTYALKSWAPHCPTTVEPDGSLTRQRRRRIPSPDHERWLLWKDKWDISDFILLNGLRATTGGFIMSHP